MNDMRSYRDDDYRYDNRDYDMRYDNRDYREDYREDYRRDYDRRGGKINNRDYSDYRYNRSYRQPEYYEELEMTMEDMREGYRKLEDISEMAHNQQDKNMLMRIAQKEKENYMAIKQMAEKQM